MRSRLITIGTALFLAAALCACSNSNTDKRPEASEAIETDTSEASEPLTEESLEGIWVDDLGFVCRFDFENDIFTDSYGNNYQITGIGEQSITLSGVYGQSYEDLAYNNYLLPVGNQITIDASVVNGGLYILDTVAYNTESEEGTVFTDQLRDKLAGHTLALGAAGMTLSFNDDMTTASASSFYGQGETVDISFTGASIQFGDDDSGEMIFWTQGEDVIILNRGQIGYSTTTPIEIPRRWVLYDASTGEAQILDMTDSKNGDSLSLITSPGTALLETEYGTFVQLSRLSGAYVNDEIMQQYSDSSTYSTTYLIDMRTPSAMQFLQRQETLASDPGNLSEYQIPFSSGHLSLDLYGNEWPMDYVIVNECGPVQFPDYTNMAEPEFISDILYVDVRDNSREITITYEYDGQISDDVSVYRYNNQTNEFTELETFVSDGQITASADESGAYFLGTVDYAVMLTPGNYFETAPEDTIWAVTGETGDIIPLVDMDYIAQSYNSVFVVDSVEDLASLTYFVNTYPVDGYAPSCVWVDLIADIDLTGYEWVPLGLDDPHFENSVFSGIFAGNGHTIRGIHIDCENEYNAFFGCTVFATVIGLNIEDAYVGGEGSGLLVCNASTTEFYDCHASGTTPDNDYEGTDLFSGSEYGNNRFFDCSISVTNANGQFFDIPFSFGEPDENSINELQDLFDPEHDGTYDYSTDYFFGSNIPG